MRKLTILLLALALALNTAAALADGPTAIDGLSPRDIEIHQAGLNPSADEMIAQGISPTTGRKLDLISCPEGFSGTVVTKKYQPVMVQISNDRNGIGYLENGKPYAVAPVNGSYADVVYEACQVMGGAETRMSMIFSDTVPDYVGFLRSTRLTHVRIRQEWDCVFCSSGYARADVPQEWARLGVKTPANAGAGDELLVYLGDVGTNKAWKKYVRRLKGIKDVNSELFELAKIMDEIVPREHVPANHTWKFTDELPAEGDTAEIIYVTFGSQYNTDSRLEYDEEDNVYIRYVDMKNDRDMEYRESVLVNPKDVDERKDGMPAYRVEAEDRIPGDTITFSNVIVQGITMNWKGSSRPDPVLTGTGNADYFIGGKHIAGVWEREDIDSRTVFYGPDGEEIELQRGRTLIILMGYNNQSSKVEYE
ncbi:MAG: DUF3048 C-terminal domain-containing protein [Eubacteriales bacterium]